MYRYVCIDEWLRQWGWRGTIHQIPQRVTSIRNMIQTVITTIFHEKIGHSSSSDEHQKEMMLLLRLVGALVFVGVFRMVRRRPVT